MPRIASALQFEIPDVQAKQVTKYTLAVYKSHLNKLVPFGFKTIDDLMARPVEGVKAVQKIPEKYQRMVLYAIFQALGDTEFIFIENPYYLYLQTLKDDSDPTKKK